MAIHSDLRLQRTLYSVNHHGTARFDSLDRICGNAEPPERPGKPPSTIERGKARR